MSEKYQKGATRPRAQCNAPGVGQLCCVRVYYTTHRQTPPPHRHTGTRTTLLIQSKRPFFAPYAREGVPTCDMSLVCMAACIRAAASVWVSPSSSAMCCCVCVKVRVQGGEKGSKGRVHGVFGERVFLLSEVAGQATSWYNDTARGVVVHTQAHPEKGDPEASTTLSCCSPRHGLFQGVRTAPEAARQGMR